MLKSIVVLLAMVSFPCEALPSDGFQDALAELHATRKGKSTSVAEIEAKETELLEKFSDPVRQAEIRRVVVHILMQSNNRAIRLIEPRVKKSLVDLPGADGRLQLYMYLGDAHSISGSKLHAGIAYLDGRPGGDGPQLSREATGLAEPARERAAFFRPDP